MGLLISVYRDANTSYDCTNGGVSSKFTQLCVTNIEGPFEPSEDVPAVRLVEGPFNSVRLVPEELHITKTWVMYGGNIGVTSDSRFSDAIAKMTGRKFADGIVKIFDRVEDTYY